MKTYSAKKEDIQKKWYLVDAQDKVLGRLACELAKVLMGKGKAVYTSHVDTGDYVIVINADKVSLTGKKWEDKVYYHYSGYPGGMKSITAKKMKEEKPADLLELAVRRMLPKNRLGRDMYRKLKVYASSEHPHTAQKPEVLEI
jgi:large subunit ribosomal protein L13